MTNPSGHEHGNVPVQSPKKALNWGWITLGGCLGLVLILSPLIVMVLGMALSSMGEKAETRRRMERTPEPSELVCYEVAPAVAARIEAGLTIGGHLRGLRAVHSSLNAEKWWLAADVQGAKSAYAGDHDIAVWRLITRGNPSTGEGAPETAIPTGGGIIAGKDDTFAAEVGLASKVSYFPLALVSDRPDLEDAAEACAVAAVTGGV